MYILAYEKDIQTASIRNAFHEKMPDGRLILSGQEVKMAGSIADCQIVATARQLRDLIDRQKAEMPSTGNPETEEPAGGFSADHNGSTETGDTAAGADTGADAEAETETQETVQADGSGNARTEETLTDGTETEADTDSQEAETAGTPDGAEEEEPSDTEDNISIYI